MKKFEDQHSSFEHAKVQKKGKRFPGILTGK